MKNRILIVIGGIVVLVLLLAGAAFVGAQLLTGRGLSGLAPSGGGRPDFQLAKELPQTPADAQGIFDHRKDNSVFVGTGQVRKNAQTDQRGDVTAALTHDGPTVEVVVTSQTILYRDVTMDQFNGRRPSDSTNVQQVVEPGTLDEIVENCQISAWGKKTGDRIIADVLVYVPPPPVRNAQP